MRVTRLVRHGKRPFGFGCGLWAKVAATATLGLCFILLSSTFSSPSSSISSSQRGSFSDIPRLPNHHHPGTPPLAPVAGHKEKVDNATAAGPKHAADVEPHSDADKSGVDGAEEKLNGGGDEEEEVVADAGEDEASDQPAGDGDPDPEKEASLAADSLESDAGSSKAGKVTGGGPLFDPGAHYAWKLCNVRTGHNYVPCLDIESPPGKKLRRVRHHERSCPKTPMCLVPLPDGYASPIRWPDSKSRVCVF